MSVQKQPTTIIYKYVFFYQGNEKYKSEPVKGVSLTIAIKLYKYGNMLPITIEPMYKGHFINEIFDVSINKFYQYSIEKNKFMERIFKDIYRFDEAEYEIIEYTIETLAEPNKKNISLNNIELPTIKSNIVSEAEMRSMIANNIEDFLLKENKKAKVEKASLIHLEAV